MAKPQKNCLKVSMWCTDDVLQAATVASLNGETANYTGDIIMHKCV